MGPDGLKPPSSGTCWDDDGKALSFMWILWVSFTGFSRLPSEQIPGQIPGNKISPNQQGESFQNSF